MRVRSFFRLNRMYFIKNLKMDGRRCTTVRQLELMLEFLEKNKDLALGRGRSKEARAIGARLWAECAEILNSEGPARKAKEWSKVWNDLKCKVRAKLVSINASQRDTGGGPCTSVPASLTPIEEKVANILGKDVQRYPGPLPNDHFTTTDLQNNQDILIEEIDERVNEGQSFLNHTIVLENNETKVQIPQMTQVASSVPSESGQVPPISPSVRVTRVRERRRAWQASRQSIFRPAPPPCKGPLNYKQPSRMALEQSRQMVLEIERLRAQADLKVSEAMHSFSESFRLIAQSIDRFSEKYCQQQ